MKIDQISRKIRWNIDQIWIEIDWNGFIIQNNRSKSIKLKDIDQYRLKLRNIEQLTFKSIKNEVNVDKNAYLIENINRICVEINLNSVII